MREGEGGVAEGLCNGKGVGGLEVTQVGEEEDWKLAVVLYNSGPSQLTPKLPPLPLHLPRLFPPKRDPALLRTLSFSRCTGLAVRPTHPPPPFPLPPSTPILSIVLSNLMCQSATYIHSDGIASSSAITVFPACSHTSNDAVKRINGYVWCATVHGDVGSWVCVERNSHRRMERRCVIEGKTQDCR